MEAEVGACDPQRPVYLLGESFGALLALAVAAARPDLVDRLVLANPATAFPRSPWARLGPLLPRVPPVPPRPPAPPRPRRASSARRPPVPSPCARAPPTRSARAAHALRARRPWPRAPSGAAARRRCTRRCRSRSRPRSATPSCWPRSAWTPPRRWRSRRAGQPPCRSATLRGARRLRARARAGLQAPEPHRITAGPAAQASAFGEGVAALLPQLQMLARVLPPPTLAWKLRLIEEGCACGPAQPAR